MTERPDDGKVTGADAGWGLVFVVSGTLVVVLSFLMLRRAVAVPWLLGFLVGPALVVLGVNVLVQGFRARLRGGGHGS